MTKAELIKRLEQYPDDIEIMIRDGNYVLDLNVGPCDYTITQENEDDCGDCDGRVGEQVVLIGGGSY